MGVVLVSYLFSIVVCTDDAADVRPESVAQDAFR